MGHLPRLLIATVVACAAAYVMTSCGPTCDPSSCKTCCDANGYCVAQISDLACGASGYRCASCSLAESCLFGRCMARNGGPRPGGGAGGNVGGGGGVGGMGEGGGGMSGMGGGFGGGGIGGGGGGAPVCSSFNCLGCCQPNSCFAGTSELNCGRSGSACQTCGSGLSCINGVCVNAGASACHAQGLCTRTDGGCGEPCTSGCCLPDDPDGRCNPSPSFTSCGYSGYTCMGCDAGQICVTVPDGGSCL